MLDVFQLIAQNVYLPIHNQLKTEYFKLSLK